jgi:hypothetical protein
VSTESLSLNDTPGSMLGAIEGLDRMVASEDLETLRDTLLERVMLDMFESREGGSDSGKAVAEGDCNLDDGPETTTGEETDVPPGLCDMIPDLYAALLRVSPAAKSVLAAVGSLDPPTEAFRRLYKPLKPPGTRSMPLGSLMDDGAGGTVKSSKVVSVSDRDAVACICWSMSCMPRWLPAMAANRAYVQFRVDTGTWQSRRGSG